MMIYKRMLLSLFFILGLIFTTNAQPKQDYFKTVTHSLDAKANSQELKEANKVLDVYDIRPKLNQAEAYPNGHILFRNPPTLIWPSYNDAIISHSPEDCVKYNYPVTYDIQLSTNQNFEKLLIDKKDSDLPFYNNYSPFDNGNYFWRYRTKVDGEYLSWSQVYSFSVTDDVLALAVKPFDLVKKNLPKEYPRVNITADDLDLSYADHKLIKRILFKELRVAEKHTKEDYNPDLKKKKDGEKSLTKFEKATAKKFRIKNAIGNLSKDVQATANAYMLTEDEKYIEKAKEYVDMILSFGLVEMYHGNDFGATSGMSSLVVLYDVFNPYFSEEINKKILDNIAGVGDLVYHHSLGSSPTGVYFISAHFFQITAKSLLTAGLVTMDKIPQAEVWVKYLYDIWLARAPAGGFVLDGGWANGHQGYFQVNMITLISYPSLFKKYFGANLYEHPWYQSVGYTQLYTYPPRSAGDGFGDGLENLKSPSARRADFAYIIGQETNNPYSVWYAEQIAKKKEGESYKFSKKDFMNYRIDNVMTSKKLVKSKSPKDLPKAMALPQSGSVLMHTDLVDQSKDLFVSFHSSPFGAGSHAHPEQNSFNLLYGGSPIFYPLGYRVTTYDEHYAVDHKHTRAKNTILPDGKSQSWSSDGYGWIPRYLHGDNITYTVGDASNAYSRFDHSASNWINVLKKAGRYNDENGHILQENPRVNHFKRHIALLRPNVVVIYDELKAEKDVDWQFVLNARETAPIEVISDGLLLARGKHAWATALVRGTYDLKTELNDKYIVEPIDWLNPNRGRKERDFTATHYKTMTGPVNKVKEMRFITVIQVNSDKTIAKLEQNKDGSFDVNGYHIEAELDVTKAPRLEVNNASNKASLIYGESDKVPFREYKNSTILKDEVNGEMKIVEGIDTLPLKIADKNK